MPDFKRLVREHLPIPPMKRRREEKIVEELALQLADLYRDARARGLDDEQALADALGQIPDWEAFASDIASAERPNLHGPGHGVADDIDVALRRRGGAWRVVADLAQDTRYAFRTLGRRPLFLFAVVVTMALGIGANTAVFSVFQAMLGVPYRFADADELVTFRTTNDRGGSRAVSAPDAADIREQAGSFVDVALYTMTTRHLTGRGEAERVTAFQATANLLPLLGLDPPAGRWHRDDEDAPGADRVVLLGERLWHRRFDGNLDVLGQTIAVNGEAHTVIGILPPELDFLSPFADRVDLWLPLPVELDAAARGRRAHFAVARLKPGVTIAQAQTEVGEIAAQLAEAYPDSNTGTGVRLQSLPESVMPFEDRLLFLTLLVAVGAVLLIACVNLANMLLATATARVREFAVRTALGASRGRIIRQLMAESLLLALAGGLAGLLAAAWAVNLFVLAYEADLPVMLTGSPDALVLNAPVFLYALAVSLATAVAFGLAPALGVSKVSVTTSLKEGESASAGLLGGRFRNGLVVGQLAFSLPLVICCGLTLSHVSTLRHIDLGFDPEPLIAMSVELPAQRYEDPSQRAAFFDRAVAAVGALPGMAAAGASTSFPLGNDGVMSRTRIGVDGVTFDQERGEDYAGYQAVTPDYFRALGLPVIAGRAFTEADRAGAEPVAMVSARLAERYWPDRAIGSSLVLDAGSETERRARIVGVVGDAGRAIMGGPPPPVLYLPHQQRPSGRMIIVARAAGDRAAIVPLLHPAIRALDAEVPIYDVRTVDDIVGQWLRDDQMLAGFLAGLAALALGLASVGLFGMMTFLVAGRTREIGIRVALGAAKTDVLGMVMRHCLRLAFGGVLAGLLLSVPIGYALASQLYGVDGADPLSYLGVTALLLAIALTTGYLPARRALRVDPMVALRHE